MGGSGLERSDLPKRTEADIGIRITGVTKRFSGIVGRTDRCHARMGDESPGTRRPVAHRCAAVCVAACCLLACTRERTTPAVPSSQYTRPAAGYALPEAGPEPPSVSFSDVTEQAGIGFRHGTGTFGERWMPESMGSGCLLLASIRQKAATDQHGYTQANKCEGHASRIRDKMGTRIGLE
jgi:hypothetical protein